MAATDILGHPDTGEATSRMQVRCCAMKFLHMVMLNSWRGCQFARIFGLCAPTPHSLSNAPNLPTKASQ
jgi:hypothetical protein